MSHRSSVLRAALETGLEVAGVASSSSLSNWMLRCLVPCVFVPSDKKKKGGKKNTDPKASLMQNLTDQSEDVRGGPNPNLSDEIRFFLLL